MNEIQRFKDLADALEKDYLTMGSSTKKDAPSLNDFRHKLGELYASGIQKGNRGNTLLVNVLNYIISETTDKNVHTGTAVNRLWAFARGVKMAIGA